jgi:hypothetical protein
MFKNEMKKSITIIELESGSRKYKNNWIIFYLYGAHTNMDLHRRLPILNISVDEFFTSHFLDYLRSIDMHKILMNWFLKLKNELN